MNKRMLVTRMVRTGMIVALALGMRTGVVAAQQQQTLGRIVGRVIDATTGTGLNGVVVRAQPEGASTLSGVDGRYALNGVPSGTVSVAAGLLGYSAKTVTDIAVTAGAATELNIALNPAALELGEITVSAAAERGSVARALDQQRNSTNIVSAITSEQMARSPDGDAAAALQRVSGVTVQEGKFVFVRGLGERYTTTSLNGARIPSPEPERKTVPLDMFPAGLLQTITTSKTFTPDLPGDFSGAQVNIETREFPGDRQVTFSVVGGFNTRVTGKDIPTAPTVGPEWLGFAGGARQLPGIVDQVGNFNPPPTQAETNRMINSFRNVWTPEMRSGSPNGSFGVSVGGTGPMLSRDVSYLASLTYSRSQEVKSDQVRAIAQPDGSGGTEESDRYEGTSGTMGVLWGGLLQASSLLNTNTRLVLNATYNRTSDNTARLEYGNDEQFAVPLEVRRLGFVERSVYSAQLKGDHELGHHRLDWLATASGVDRNEPDRSEFVYFRQTDPNTGEQLPPEWFSNASEGAVRAFGELKERSWEGGANLRTAIGSEGRHALRIGSLFRYTDRDALSRNYSITANLASASDRRLEPEEIFDGRYTEGADNAMRIAPLFQGGSYAAQERLVAGFAMLEFALADRASVIAGARFENSSLQLDAEPILGASSTVNRAYNDILPAVSLNLRLSDKMNLRVSASQTLARPEYREIANVGYREVISAEQVTGNKDLVRTLIRNADVRWEWYPNAGEVVSVALFGKVFKDPIERVYLPTSGTLVATFVNAEAASNYGVELEARKRLGVLAAALEPLSAFANATLMQSEITIGEGPSSRTNDNRAMVGQAPYVVNAGLTWAAGEGASSATLLYNVVGKRIVTAGQLPLPDSYELPRNVLDFSLRLGVTPKVSAKLDLKNLIDAPYQQRQGTVTREYYRTGRVLSVGVSWRN